MTASVPDGILYVYWSFLIHKVRRSLSSESLKLRIVRSGCKSATLSPGSSVIHEYSMTLAGYHYT